MRNIISQYVNLHVNLYVIQINIQKMYLPFYIKDMKHVYLCYYIYVCIYVDHK